MHVHPSSLWPQSLVGDNGVADMRSTGRALLGAQATSCALPWHAAKTPLQRALHCTVTGSRRYCTQAHSDGHLQLPKARGSHSSHWIAGPKKSITQGSRRPLRLSVAGDPRHIGHLVVLPYPSIDLCDYHPCLAWLACGFRMPGCQDGGGPCWAVGREFGRRLH